MTSSDIKRFLGQGLAAITQSVQYTVHCLFSVKFVTIRNGLASTRASTSKASAFCIFLLQVGPDSSIHDPSQFLPHASSKLIEEIKHDLEEERKLVQEARK